MKWTATALLVAMFVGLASFACGGASTGYDVVAEPRRVSKPATCNDYANAREVSSDERAGKLTKSDERWLDMDGDGRFCEEPGAEWKDERTHAE